MIHKSFLGNLHWVFRFPCWLLIFVNKPIRNFDEFLLEFSRYPLRGGSLSNSTIGVSRFRPSTFIENRNALADVFVIFSFLCYTIQTSSGGTTTNRTLFRFCHPSHRGRGIKGLGLVIQYEQSKLYRISRKACSKAHIR